MAADNRTSDASRASDARPVAHLSRKYHLSASHRLHTAAYDAEHNQSMYGKCNNPFGHGHNYVVQITLRGPVDAVTGMVCDLGALDAFARTHLLDRFDQANLNTLECFAETVSTTENLAIEVQRIFAAFKLAKLDRVHIEETGNNSFDFAGEDGHDGPSSQRSKSHRPWKGHQHGNHTSLP